MHKVGVSCVSCTNKCVHCLSSLDLIKSDSNIHLMIDCLTRMQPSCGLPAVGCCNSKCNWLAIFPSNDVVNVPHCAITHDVHLQGTMETTQVVWLPVLAYTVMLPTKLWLSEWVSRVLCPARHTISHFRDESFQAITCTSTDNSKQAREKIHQKHKK